jgi:Zn-dependent protease
MHDQVGLTAPAICAGCGTELGSSVLVCPSCHRLVHAERLKELAAEAGRADDAGDLTGALTAWRSALELLPAGTRQQAIIAQRVADLGRRVDAGGGNSAGARPVTAKGGKTGPSAAGTAAGLGVTALLLLSKAKFLLLGLTKASTFFSMLAWLGAYAVVFGWPLAAGLVISIYIHEMGHVAVLLRYGVKASAPLFIPGIGAMIRLRQELTDPRQNARVGLAGPLWGLGAAAAAYGIYIVSGYAIWAAIAKLGAMINLFNLLPLWQLDGGRAFHSLTRAQRWAAAVALAAAWYATSSARPAEPNLLILLVIVAVVQAGFGKPARERDAGALLLYVFLVAALSALMMIPVALR